jgi:hypothetical protein
MVWYDRKINDMVMGHGDPKLAEYIGLMFDCHVELQKRREKNV